MAQTGNNVVDRLRIEMGLTRPKMLELIGAKAGRLALLSAPDEQVDPIFQQRAHMLKRLYDQWISTVLTRLDTFERHGVSALTSVELQGLLSLRDLHIAQLRGRGTIEAVRRGHSYYYTADSLRTLIQRNSTALVEDDGCIRGPLAFGFLHWLGANGGDGLDLTERGARGAIINEQYGQAGEKALVLV